jgi:hypothetical protein
MSQDALGLLLVQEGIISQPQLYEALWLQRHNKRLLGTCLIGLGHLKPETLLVYQSRLLEIPALPPGMVVRAAPEAIRRVPAELAFRLRIVPYSWDGQLLGVAIADEAVLSSLPEVAYTANAAVGAYLALETEIDAALPLLYRTEAPAVAVPHAETEDQTFRRPLSKVFRGAPPPVPSRALPLDRISFYDATALIYEAQTVEEIGQCLGQALLKNFGRVVVLKIDGEAAKLSSYAGSAPSRTLLALTAMPTVRRGLAGPRFVYGSSTGDLRSRELSEGLGIEPGATSLIFLLSMQSKICLMVQADNGPATELYDDIHDIEMLLKEADSAVGLLKT